MYIVIILVFISILVSITQFNFTPTHIFKFFQTEIEKIYQSYSEHKLYELLKLHEQNQVIFETNIRVLKDELEKKTNQHNDLILKYNGLIATNNEDCKQSLLFGEKGTLIIWAVCTIYVLFLCVVYIIKENYKDSWLYKKLFHKQIIFAENATVLKEKVVELDKILQYLDSIEQIKLPKLPKITLPNLPTVFPSLKCIKSSYIVDIFHKIQDVYKLYIISEHMRTNIQYLFGVGIMINSISVINQSLVLNYILVTSPKNSDVIVKIFEKSQEKINKIEQNLEKSKQLLDTFLNNYKKRIDSYDFNFGHVEDHVVNLLDSQELKSKIDVFRENCELFEGERKKFEENINKFELNKEFAFEPRVREENIMQEHTLNEFNLSGMSI